MPKTQGPDFTKLLHAAADSTLDKLLPSTIADTVSTSFGTILPSISAAISKTETPILPKAIDAAKTLWETIGGKERTVTINGVTGQIKSVDPLQRSDGNYARPEVLYVEDKLFNAIYEANSKASNSTREAKNVGGFCGFRTDGSPLVAVKISLDAIATPDSRLDMGATLKHELAHAKGYGEGVAYTVGDQYLKKNGQSELHPTIEDKLDHISCYDDPALIKAAKELYGNLNEEVREMLQEEYFGDDPELFNKAMDSYEIKTAEVNQGNRKYLITRADEGSDEN